MTYEKQNFVAGQVLKAEHLNHMEEGIEKAMNSGGAVEYFSAMSPKVKKGIEIFQKSVDFSGRQKTWFTGETSENVAIPFVAGETYFVNWNGINYACVCTVQTEREEIGSYKIYAIGNEYIFDDTAINTGEPFRITVAFTEGQWFATQIYKDTFDGETITISIAQAVGGDYVFTLNVDGNGTPTCDKTLTDIVAAYDMGYKLKANINVTIAQLGMVMVTDTASITFAKAGGNIAGMLVHSTVDAGLALSMGTINVVTFSFSMDLQGGVFFKTDFVMPG